MILMLYALVLMVSTAPGVAAGVVLGVAFQAPPFLMGLPVFLWNTASAPGLFPVQGDHRRY